MTHACTANLSCTHAVRRLVVVALAAVLVAATAAIAVWPHGLAAPLRQVPVATTRLPVAALAPVSRALGQDDPSYRAQRSAGALIAVNAAQRLRAQFERGSLVVSTGGLSLGLRLRAYGYGAADQQLAAVAPRVAADRVVYGHTGVTEWYANGPLGAAYIFVRPGSGWADETQTAKLTASDGAAGDQFGTSVAISGNTAVAGAPGATASGNFLQGAA